MQIFFGRLGNDQLDSKKASEQNLGGIQYDWWWSLLTVDGRNPAITTWDVKNPVNNGINCLSTGAGFLPSTVWALKGHMSQH